VAFFPSFGPPVITKLIERLAGVNSTLLTCPLRARLMKSEVVTVGSFFPPLISVWLAR
jgi:hypothetical protein